MNDDFLTKHRQQPRREFAEALYRRVSEPMVTHTSNYAPLRRAALALGALALILAATLVVSPGARAFAADLLRKIGPFNIVDAPGDARLQGPDMTQPRPTAEPFDGTKVQHFGTAHEISKAAGFSVLAPAALPASYTQAGDYALTPTEGGVVAVSVFTGGEHFIGLNQYKFGPNEQFDNSIGQGEVLSDIEVRGVRGVAVTNRYMSDPSGKGGEPSPSTWILWEQGGITYTLFSNALGIGELVRFAEGLR